LQRILKIEVMMKKFFNVIIPDRQTARLFLYGDIGDYEGKPEDIVAELMNVQQAYNKIELHINSNGGEVYPGIAIVNALRNSPADISIYVDGIAASMASIIALCGKPLYMSKYARLMIHSVKVGVYGDKEDLRVTIEEVEALENTLCNVVAGKMKKTPEEIKALYFDGKDHWITATQAQETGLIDGIYDAPILESAKAEMERVIKDCKETKDCKEIIYNTFNNRLEDIQTKIKKEMNIEEIKKRKSFVNAATDADVLQVIDSLETEAARVPVLTEQNTALQTQVTAFEAKEKAAEEAERNALLDAAVADERIKQPQRAHFEALLKVDPVNGRAVLEGLTPKKRVMNVFNQKSQEPAVSAWDARMAEIEGRIKGV
jgi:ATP-dependent Clp endopeptidase proteolytic subunit ClpP